MAAPDIDRQLQEAERTRQKLRIVSMAFFTLSFSKCQLTSLFFQRSQAVEDEHEAVRRERQSDLRSGDVQTVSEAYEQLEKQLFLNEFKLNAYKKVDAELDELVKERRASVG